MGKRSNLELAFERAIIFNKLPNPVREYNFHNWRFDFAWPWLKIAIEIDGGTFVGSCHVRGVGYERDCKKNNLAQLEGWVVLRANSNMVSSGEFARVVKSMIRRRILWKKKRILPYGKLD